MEVYIDKYRQPYWQSLQSPRDSVTYKFEKEKGMLLGGNQNMWPFEIHWIGVLQAIFISS